MRGIRTIDIVNIMLISVMWLAVIVGNVIIKKIQPGFSKLYFFYSMAIALGIREEGADKILDYYRASKGAFLCIQKNKRILHYGYIIKQSL